MSHNNYPSSHDNSPSLVPSNGNLDLSAQEPNTLSLDEHELGKLASSIATRGITRDELLGISQTRITESNPLFSHYLGAALDDIEQRGGDVRSFNRGATLAYHLIDKAAPGGAPIMGQGSIKLASQYKDRPDTYEALQVAANGLLDSQTSLNEAFNTAASGLPEGTDYDVARFGAGIVLLGEMAAAHFGGTGEEGWAD